MKSKAETYLLGLFVVSEVLYSFLKGVVGLKRKFYRKWCDPNRGKFKK